MKVTAQSARASEWGGPALKGSDCVSGQRTRGLDGVCLFTGCLSLELQWLKKKNHLQIYVIVK